MEDADDNSVCAHLLGSEFGLTSVGDVRAIGERSIRVTVFLWPDEATLNEFVPLSPRERRDVAAAWFKATFERITSAIPIKRLKRSRRWMRYQSFEGELTGDTLLRLLHERGVNSVHVWAVEGRQPTRRSTPQRLEWYAVQARFAIQVEGQTDGMQLFEDRIVLVKARDFEDAKQRLQPEFAEYGSPYFNGAWELVRWKFERVLDVYETSIEGFDPKGTEAFSTLRRRRMRPELAWDPRRESMEGK